MMETANMSTLADFFAEEEKRLEEKAKAEIAAERAAWEALPQAEKDRINAECDAYWARLEDMIIDDVLDRQDFDDEDDGEDYE